MATYLFKLITLVLQMGDILPSIKPQGNILLELNPADEGNCLAVVRFVPWGLNLVC